MTFSEEKQQTVESFAGKQDFWQTDITSGFICHLEEEKDVFGDGRTMSRFFFFLGPVKQV